MSKRTTVTLTIPLPLEETRQYLAWLKDWLKLRSRLGTPERQRKVGLAATVIGGADTGPIRPIGFIPGPSDLRSESDPAPPSAHPRTARSPRRTRPNNTME